MNKTVDILIPTCSRPAALAVTLTSLASQDWKDFRVVVSDQSEEAEVSSFGEVKAAARVLELHGCPVEFHRHLPRLGMAEQRCFLLSNASAPYSLFLDDDVILEPYTVGLMVRVLKEKGCGFAGSALIGLSFLDDFRPHQQEIEFWEGPVMPERIEPGTKNWERYVLHNAANLYHVQERLGVTPQNPRAYKIAWVGGCVLYDTGKLRQSGGYEFWIDLPEKHSGEDVIAQWQVMAYYGGCGVLPSGAYHQELPTTVPERDYDAPKMLDLGELLERNSRRFESLPGREEQVYDG